MAKSFDPDVFTSGSGTGYDSDVFNAAPPAPVRAPRINEQPTRNGLIDAGNALGTGFWRGAARVAGLPVDTVANVLDLGKAAAGSAYLAATGKVPPAWLEVGDRSKVVGSGDYLLSKLRDAGAGAMVDPANPAYEGGYLQAAGSGATAMLAPGSALQVLNRGAQGVLSAGAGKLAYDLTGSTPLSIAASMLPGGAQQYAEAGAKRLIRGGEAGRREMQQRITDLEAAGITNPTLGLASGNRLIGGVENLLQNTPGAIGVMSRARDAAVAGMQGKVGGAADMASPLRGATVAGQAIQSDLKGAFPERFRTGQERLYGALDRQIPARTPVNVTNTDEALTRLTDTIPGAEQTSQGFINGRISRIKQGLDVDTGRVASGPTLTSTTPILGAVAESGRDMMNRPVFRGEQVATSQSAVPVWAAQPPVTTDAIGLPRAQPSRLTGTQATSAAVYGSMPMRTDAMGLPVPAGPVVGSQTTTVPPKRSTGAFAGLGVESPFTPTMPYEAVRKLRSSVGSELSNASLAPDVPTAQWKQLYAGLSRDMQGAATQAGPAAEAAWSRANNYTRAGLSRMERVAPLANAKAPEDAFLALARTTREHVSTLQAVKKSVTPETRGQIAGTVIDRLGKAAPGAQNELSDTFSTERFLTNWNGMTPKARNELFSGFPGAGRVRADVEAAAKAASMMRENSRMWANPSGTAANTAARALLFGTPLTYGLDPMLPAAIGAGLAATNMTARLLAGPKAAPLVREWATSPTNRAAITAPGLLGGLQAQPLLGADDRRSLLLAE